MTVKELMVILADMPEYAEVLAISSECCGCNSCPIKPEEGGVELSTDGEKVIIDGALGAITRTTNNTGG